MDTNLLNEYLDTIEKTIDAIRAEMEMGEAAPAPSATAPAPAPEETPAPPVEWSMETWGQPLPGKDQVGGYIWRTENGVTEEWGVMFGDAKTRHKQIKNEMDPHWANEVEKFYNAIAKCNQGLRGRHVISTMNRTVDGVKINKRNHGILLQWIDNQPSSAVIFLPNLDTVQIDLERVGKVYIGTITDYGP